MLPLIRAMTELTAICLSGVVSIKCVISPSSTASTSIVALSVSISANISPAETVSPTLTNHLLITPSDIVGDNAGIKTLIAIYFI